MPAILEHLRSDESVGADVLVVPVSTTENLHRRLEGVGRGGVEAALRAIDLGDFAAQPGQQLLVHARGIERFPRVLLVGVAEDAAQADIRALFTQTLKHPVFAQADSLAVHVGAALGSGAALTANVAAATDGFLAGTFRWTKQTQNRPKAPGRMVFLARTASDLKRVAAGVELGRAIGDSVIAAREMANTPAGDMGPSELADAAKEIANEFGLKIKVLSGKQLEKENCHAIRTVGQASTREPNLIVMEYDGGGAEWIALVGKGLVYDTGGLSLKPTSSMVEMKFDKCGACAVLGAIRAAAALKLPQKIVAIVPAVENSVAGNAYRPGDVIDSRSGQTIEVLNTDAEGRLVLADGLDYAVTEYSPQVILDAATLTGAAYIAVGDHACAMMANDDKVAERLEAAGLRSGERAWRLPMWEVYKRDIDSLVADVRNTSAHGAGTIAGGAFLERFVRDVPWGHLDIGCVSRDRRDPKSGGTGFGVRLLVETLRAWPVRRAKAAAKRAGAKAAARPKASAKAKAKAKAKTKAKSGSKAKAPAKRRAKAKARTKRKR